MCVKIVAKSLKGLKIGSLLVHEAEDFERKFVPVLHQAQECGWRHKLGNLVSAGLLKQ